MIKNIILAMFIAFVSNAETISFSVSGSPRTTLQTRFIVLNYASRCGLTVDSEQLSEGNTVFTIQVTGPSAGLDCLSRSLHAAAGTRRR